MDRSDTTKRKAKRVRLTRVSTFCGADFVMKRRSAQEGKLKRRAPDAKNT